MRRRHCGFPNSSYRVERLKQGGVRMPLSLWERGY
jgi:hypothetical protein